MKKILVIDDDSGVRRLLKRALSDPACQIVEARDGVEGARLAIAEKPDLILLDVDMPRMDGRDLIRELRSNVQTSMIPVILLTGSDALADKIQGLELGADDYMTKPFDIQELMARVAAMLRRNFRALTANPLTLLAGAPTIEEEVSRRIRLLEPFAFLYLDLDNFKAFNDAYGYVRGDRVLKALADLLGEIVHSTERSRSFLGHIGGDDFVVVSSPRCAEEIANQIVDRFDRLAPSFYSEGDRERGFITAKDRQGHEQKFPIMALSISIVTTEKGDLHHYGKVVDEAMDLKRCLKTMPDREGSVYFTGAGSAARRAEAGRRAAGPGSC